MSSLCPRLALQRDVHPLAVLRGMPVEQFDQGEKRVGRLFGCGLLQRRCGRRRGHFNGAGHARLAQQVARRFGLGECGLGQPHAEVALDAGEQFTRARLSRPKSRSSS